MRKFFNKIINHKLLIIILFLFAFVCCLVMRSKVAVNYDVNDYLPESSPSTIAIDVMENEFGSEIPNARVMISDVTIPQALEYKQKLKNIDGVTDVSWLDDSVDITTAISAIDTDTLETYYKDNTALFTVTIDGNKRLDAVNSIRELIGDNNAMTGSAVSTAVATTNTVGEIYLITVVAILFVLAVLILTTKSWLDPILILVGLGVAIVINEGTNLIFGEISFVTNAAGNILQLAVSLDYSVFLIHRFDECRKENTDANGAMADALCKSVGSILSSGLTTVIGFLALVLMQFKIGPDLGLALAKGVAISLISVFIFMPCLILKVTKFTDKTTHKPFLPSFTGFGKFVSKVMIPFVCVFALAIVPAYLASNSNSYYYGSSNIFGNDTQFGKDTEKIDNVFGKSDTYVLMVPKGDTATQTKLSDELHTIDEVSSIISFVDMAGAEIPTEYIDADTLSQIEGKNYSRMVITVDAEYEGERTFALVENIRAIAEKYYPDKWYLAGNGVSTYDLMDTVTSDMIKVNALAIGAVFIVLLITMRKISVPIVLVLSIETAIWLNLSVPYFSGWTVFYIAYLIISSIQLGATVDYAILMSDRYKENRLSLDKRQSVIKTLSDVSVSILTSGSVMTMVGFLLGIFSSNQLLAQLGILIGRGALFSLGIVFFVLPGLLFIFDRLVTGKSAFGKGKGKVS